MEDYEKKDESCVVVALVVVLDGVRTTAQKLCVKSLYEIHHHDHGDVPMCPFFFFFCCPAACWPAALQLCLLTFLPLLLVVSLL
mgnify:CR=1 FL=1